ncbi:DMT family transporter [Alistipes sp.]|uniref:DMT family transporter n=1 Tax=Alistipes sp. TaxID=1872444 RepID=UPI003AF0F446
MERGKLKGHAALWVANIVWGLNAPIGKRVLASAAHPEGVSPFALSVYRMVGAALLFWAVSLVLPRERVAPRDMVLLFFASVFGIQLNQMLFLWGLSLTSPIDTSIIATVVPVLTMVLATLFLREPITWLKAGGVALGCGGALLLILSSNHGVQHASNVAGDVLCLISAVSYATYLTAFRNVIVRYSPVTTMKWMFLFAAVVAAVIYYRPLTAVDYAALSGQTWAGIAYVVAGATFLSYRMVPVGQRYLRPTVVSMYNYVQPVVAVLFTVLLGLDTFGPGKGLAAACVFAGVWLVTKSKSRAQLEAERAAEDRHADGKNPHGKIPNR